MLVKATPLSLVVTLLSFECVCLMEVTVPCYFTDFVKQAPPTWEGSASFWGLVKLLFRYVWKALKIGCLLTPIRVSLVSYVSLLRKVSPQNIKMMVLHYSTENVGRDISLALIMFQQQSSMVPHTVTIYTRMEYLQFECFWTLIKNPRWASPSRQTQHWSAFQSWHIPWDHCHGIPGNILAGACQV